MIVKWYLLSLCLFRSGIRAAYFVEDTPLVTAHPGDSASVIWILAEPESTHRILRLRIPNIFACRIIGIVRFLVCDSHHGRAELIVVPPEAHENFSIKAEAIGFRLRDVRVEDAMAYTLTVWPNDYVSRLKPVGSARAILYVFQKPNDPQIESSDGGFGQNVTFVCSAGSRSLPEKYRHMVDMEYHWSVNILEPVAEQYNETLVIRNARAVGPGARVSCTAQEEGSRLISDAVYVDTDMSPVNKPAIALGVVLALVIITVCITLGYFMYTGMLRCKKIEKNSEDGEKGQSLKTSEVGRQYEPVET